jgi:RNA-directed DNA polymerase
LNWVLDADIRSFFDSVDHEWLLRMLAHRIADPRILGLVELVAAGRRPRGRRVGARVVIVRHADDFVIGFQREVDARAMLSELAERLAVFGLTLHEQKTRLIEFGRFAATSRSHRGERRPATFAFLGFTHYCRWIRARQVHRKAQDAEQAPDAQAEGAAPRRRGG